jgi:putative transposase
LMEARLDRLRRPLRELIDLVGELEKRSMGFRRVKTIEESAYPSGYDAHKNVKGRKRHLLVDYLGSPALDLRHFGRRTR